MITRNDKNYTNPINNNKQIKNQKISPILELRFLYGTTKGVYHKYIKYLYLKNLEGAIFFTLKH